MTFSLPRLVFLLALVLTASVLQAQPSAAPASPKLKVGDPAPPLKTGKWIRGAPITRFQPGKVYVVEFWATWCAPCVESMPLLTQLQARHPELTVIGQNVLEHDVAAVQPFLEKMGDKVRYAIALDDTISNPQGFMAASWLFASGSGGIPTAFVVGKDGRIAWFGHPQGDLEMVVEQVLADKFNAAEFAETAQKKAALLDEIKTAMQTNDHATALAAIERAIALDPAKALRYKLMKFSVFLNQKDYPAAHALAGELMDRDARNEPRALGFLAWSLVDPANAVPKPDLAQAEKLATRANDLTQGREPMILDTLARVKFLQGDLDAAIRLQTDAYHQSISAGQKQEILKSLERYQNAKKAGS